MTAAWMVYSLLVGALLSAAALGLERACRLAGRPARLVWAAALAASVALALIAPFRGAPRADARILTAVAVADAGVDARADDASLIAAAGRVVARVRDTVAGEVGRLVAAAERRTSPSVDRWFGRAWGVLSAVLLLLLGAVHLRVRRARRRWPVTELLGAPVRVAPDAGPVVVGLVQPEIVVPRWLLLRTPEEQRLVIAHEQEHVRAHDPLLLAGACVATALLAWHPAAWWMLSRLRLAVELDCDGRVLRRRGVAPRAYGTLLIDLAGHRPGLGVAAAALADQPSHLERRLLAMHRKHPSLPRARAAALAALSAAALLVACEAKLPTNADVAQMDAASAERGAQRVRMFGAADSASEYYVDGARVDAARAHALKPEEIASVEVMRRDGGADAHSSVRITTRRALGLAPAAPGSEGKEKVRVKVSTLGGHPDVEVAERDKVMMRTFDGVVLIDGVRSDAATMQRLDPRAIVSIEVTKGPAAAKLYDAPEAKNGVIRITTRK